MNDDPRSVTLTEEQWSTLLSLLSFVKPQCSPPERITIEVIKHSIFKQLGRL